MHIRGLDKVIGWVVIVLRSILHDIMPDRAGARDTNYLVHSAIIAVPRPDTHGQIGSVAERPVITETVGRSRFRCCRSIQFKRIARGELVVARPLVGEDAADQESHVLSHGANALWMSSIIGIERMALAVSNFQDRCWWYTHPPVCKGGICACQVQQ